MSRYNLSRSQKFVTVQVFNCMQMRVSVCNGHYKSVLGAGAKAKSVTNNLPLLSVLWLVDILFNKLRFVSILIIKESDYLINCSFIQPVIVLNTSVFSGSLCNS